MIKNVIVFWSSGRLLFSKSYEAQEKSPHLISGFLSALSSFVKEIGEKEIRSLQMHPHKVFMSVRQNLCFSIFMDKDDEEAQGELILKNLISSFLETYPNITPDTSFDISQYSGFETAVDELYVLKNIYELVESTTSKLTPLEIQQLYEEKYGTRIPLLKCLQSLNFLVLNKAIVEVYDERCYRKKGELLKGLGLKFKK